MTALPDWLKCNITDGIFPEEYAVSCNSVKHGVFSFFASRNEYIDIEKKLIKVRVIDCENDICLVYMPFVPLEGISRTVTVHTKDLVENGT